MYLCVYFQSKPNTWVYLRFKGINIENNKEAARNDCRIKHMSDKDSLCVQCIHIMNIELGQGIV